MRGKELEQERTQIAESTKVGGREEMQAGGDWFDLTANSWLPLAEPSVPDTGISTIQTSQFIHSEASLAAKPMQVAPSTPSTSPPHPTPTRGRERGPFQQFLPATPITCRTQKRRPEGLAVVGWTQWE